MKSIWILVVVSAFVAGTLMIGTIDSAEAQENFQIDSFFDVFYEINLSPDKCDPDTLLPKVTRDLSDAPCVDPLDPANEFVIDSFFDVFYEIEETSRTVQTEILSLQFQVDSFFDVFFDVIVAPDGTEVRNTIEPLVSLFGDPDFLFGDPDFEVDSFFDIFVVIDERDRHFDTEIVSMQLVSHDPSGLFGDPDFGEIFGDPDFDPLFGDPDFPVNRPIPTTRIDSFFDVFVELDARDRHFDTEILSMDLRVSSLEDSPPSTSAVDMYIKIDDIKGESTDDKHKEWIEIDSFSHSMAPSAGAERSRGAVTLGDIVVVKQLDKSTPKLTEAVTKGKHVGDVEIDLVRTLSNGDRVTYYQYELKNVLITSYSFGGSGEGGSTPTEQVSLNFEEAKVIYTEYNDDGTSKGKVEATWKVEKGEK